MGGCSSSTAAAPASSTQRYQQPVTVRAAPAAAAAAPSSTRPTLAATAGLQRSERRVASASELPRSNVSASQIRSAAQDRKSAGRKTNNNGYQNLDGPDKNLKEFYENGGNNQDETYLEWDAAKGAFVVKDAHGRVQESTKDPTQLNQGGADLVWDPSTKRYVTRQRAAADRPRQESAPAERVLHPGVVCDSCMRVEQLLLLSMLMGCFSLEHRCIAGIRYKSAYVENFDLCEVCERLGHLAEAGPYIKIEDPARAPLAAKILIGEINDPDLTAHEGFTIHIGVTCDGCKMSDKLKEISQSFGRNIRDTIIGTRYKSIRANNFDLCEVCEASGLFDEQCAPYLKIEKPSVVSLLMTIDRTGNAYIVQ